MVGKFVKLSEESRVLLNKARAKILLSDPSINVKNYDMVIKKALMSFLGVKNGKNRRT